MSSLNKFICTGYLGKDPEVRVTPSGTKIMNLWIALNRYYRKGEEKKTETTWLNVVAFNKDALLPYLSKGTHISVSGRLHDNQWKTKDGEDRSRIEVIAEEINILSTKKDSEKDAPVIANDPAPDFQNDPDIPF